MMEHKPAESAESYHEDPAASAHWEQLEGQLSGGQGEGSPARSARPAPEMEPQNLEQGLGSPGDLMREREFGRKKIQALVFKSPQRPSHTS